MHGPSMAKNMGSHNGKKHVRQSLLFFSQFKRFSITFLENAAVFEADFWNHCFFVTNFSHGCRALTAFSKQNQSRNIIRIR